MTTFNLHGTFCGVKVDAEFKDKLCILSDDSGVGKTFLFRLFKSEYSQNSLCIDYSSYKLFNFDSRYKNCDLLLLDNGDLYLTNTILSSLVNMYSCVVVVVRNFDVYGFMEYGMYDVRFENNSLICERVGGTRQK